MREWARLIVVLICHTVSFAAQDIDSNPLIQKRSVSSIADQIVDSSERSAFLQLFPQAPPEKMLARAQAFLEQFPQSAFLAQAYEVAAHASFDMRQYATGLEYARHTLTLLPENPLLLVPVADVEAQQHLNEAAVAHADEALQDLERFAGPSSVREEDWPEVKNRLSTSANFSKGRALLQQALELPFGAKRTQLLKDSEASLVEARHSSPADAETTYTLGLAQLTSGEALAAAANFAVIYRGGGEVGKRALENLQAIYKLLHPQSDLAFETFLQSALEHGETTSQASTKSSTDTAPQVHSQPAYIGSES